MSGVLTEAAPGVIVRDVLTLDDAIDIFLEKQPEGAA